MQDSKIRLSAAEMKLFTDEEMILTKNSILQKTALLLGEVQEALITEAEKENVSFLTPPKISKGENYLGLPYLILDYPRVSKDRDLYFIRSMFWWGNFYSSTLQLSGRYKKENLSAITEAYTTLGEQSYSISISPDPWVHHFGEANYRPIHTFSKEAFVLILETMPHIKIAARWPLSEWDAAANHLVQSWKLLTGLVS